MDLTAVVFHICSAVHGLQDLSTRITARFGLDSRGEHAHNAGGKSKVEEIAWEVTKGVTFGLKSVLAYSSKTSYLTCQGFNFFHKIKAVIISLEGIGRIKCDHI